MEESERRWQECAAANAAAGAQRHPPPATAGAVQPILLPDDRLTGVEREPSRRGTGYRRRTIRKNSLTSETSSSGACSDAK
jgi:hypothetical protein